jgi:Tetracyclin repressor-like, C-terminal domain
LRRWFDLLIAAKRAKLRDDRELFATYVALAVDARDVVRAHVEALTGEIAAIIADGVASREFAVTDPAAAGRAVFDATARFHHPAHASEWSDPGIDAAFEGVWSLILRGLEARD